jgi:hypothetical protein
MTRTPAVGQVGRQLVGARHLGAMDEHWHHWDVALQRRRGLEPHEVVRIVEPAASRGVGGVDPAFADDGK